MAEIERERERRLVAGGEVGAQQAAGESRQQRRAINSHYIWVTGMLQLQQADKILLCKKRDEGSCGHRGPVVTGDVCLLSMAYVRRVS